ncbi:uncharacterized protein LOC129219240 isoform X2 [Uloborus diversus]|nr:uncharacterized protein LOC129219240 isoform X2 [Uloborus diversus]
MLKSEAPKFGSETASSLLGKSHTSSVYSTLEKEVFPNFNCQDIVEIAGTAGCGKTELLYHFICRCILPPKWKRLNTGGLNCNVILVKTRGVFNVRRIAAILEKKIKKLIVASGSSIKKADILTFIEEKLKLVYVMTCFDSDAYFSALCNLAFQIRMKKHNYIIMIDEIATFYLTDKMCASNQASFNHLNNKIVTYIKVISEKHKCPVIVTRRQIYTDEAADKKCLGALWQNMVTCDILLHLEKVTDSGTVISLANHKSGISRKFCIQNDGLTFLINS